MKSLINIISLILVSLTYIQAQTSKFGASLSYSGAFVSRGDMSGNSISVGVHYALKNKLTLNFGYSQSNTDSGYGPEVNFYENNMLAFKYSAHNLMGAGVLLTDDINKFYDEKLYIGFYNADTPELISSSNIMTIGLKYNILEGKKFSFTTGLDLSVLQHEYIFESTTLLVNLKNQFVDIENISSYPKTKLIIQEQGKFLDLGFGINFGLGYRIHKNVKLGPNVNYFYFIKSQIIILNYGLGVSLDF